MRRQVGQVPSLEPEAFKYQIAGATYYIHINRDFNSTLKLFFLSPQMSTVIICNVLFPSSYLDFEFKTFLYVNKYQEYLALPPYKENKVCSKKDMGR